jgi:hypothetical protein
MSIKREYKLVTCTYLGSPLSLVRTLNCLTGHRQLDSISESLLVGVVGGCARRKVDGLRGGGVHGSSKLYFLQAGGPGRHWQWVT